MSIVSVNFEQLLIVLTPSLPNSLTPKKPPMFIGCSH